MSESEKDMGLGIGLANVWLRGRDKYASKNPGEEAKRLGKIILASKIASSALIIASFFSPATSIGTAVFGGTVLMMNQVLIEQQSRLKKLANINDLLGKRDVSVLQDLISNNAKLIAEIEPYKNIQARDLPPKIQKKAYYTVMRQYSTLKKLTDRLDEIKSSPAVASFIKQYGY